MRKIYSKDGDAGIGTMVVLIAFLLVSILTAGILVNTANLLQTQADTTGADSAREVSGRLEALAVYGITDAVYGSVDFFFMKITLVPGSPEIRINETLIEISNGSKHVTLNFTKGVDPTGTQFSATNISDPAGMFKEGVISSGTIIRVRIDTRDVFAPLTGLPPQADLSVKIIPKHGQETLYTTRTPDAYVGTYVDLY